MEEEDDSILVSQIRPSLKTHPRYNNYQSWKQKLRENCYKRVREGRSRLLWKMRLPPTYPHSLNNQQQDFIKSAFHDIFSDELKKIKEDPSLNDYTKNSISTPEKDDVLWEYEGLQDAYGGECEEILLEMQRIFYEDRNKDLRPKGSFILYGSYLSMFKLEIIFLSRMFTQLIAESEGPIVTWEDEEDEFLALAVYEHMQLNSEKAFEKVWCPICKQGELKENNRFIYCIHCGIQLNKGDEVTLELIRVRLADVHAEHLDRGCRLKPTFCVECRFDITALYISCEGCSTFEVVI